MPHFTLQVQQNGPILQAYVGVSQTRRVALTAAKQPIPPPVLIQALVDTGASSTCVEKSILTGLGLTPTGSVSINTPSTGSQPHIAEQFDVSVWVPGGPNQQPLNVPNLPVICAELFAVQQHHALIGRDILALCLLSYNGSAGTFTLAY